MKKQLLLISGFLLYSVFSYSQTSTTQPNGVIVHEAQGVEGSQKQSEKVPNVRTINDWSLAECIDAEPYFYNKLTTAASEDDKKYYNAQVEMLRKRKAELMTPQPKSN